jgi:hypothetical protein
LVAAGIVEAERDQVMHPKLAHVAERHRRGGWLLVRRRREGGRTAVQSQPFLCTALSRIQSVRSILPAVG